MKKIIITLSLLILLIVIAGISNAYLFVPSLKREGEVVAYRAGGGSVNYSKLNETGCTAKSLLESEVGTVENTLEAASTSVQAGTDVLHLNVHRTLDDQLVVFHDWTLDCATNASGQINKTLFRDIQKVDAGFGYTFDDGATFPFRGLGFRISKLDEFVSRFPEYEFWLNLKDNDEHSFDVLYRYLASKPFTHAQDVLVITSSKGINWFRKADSLIPVVSVDGVRSCGVDYLLLGWAGIVPESCKNTTLLIPPSKAKYFWGYPKRLAARLQEHGTEVYLWSKHKPVDERFANVVAEGVGVVTSDNGFMSKVKANKSVN